MVEAQSPPCQRPPPPYPNFPVPYEGPHPSATHSQPVEQPRNPNNYDFGQVPPRRESWEQVPNALSPAPNYARYTVHAKANLWLLIQDPNGKELDWLKLQAGDKVPISHLGALTLTCSSGKEVEIFDRNGKKVEVPDSDKPGITIIRLN